MFKDLAENTGEGDPSVICSRCFITFFEDGADLGSTPFCGEFACLDGAFKDDLNNWSMTSWLVTPPVAQTICLEIYLQFNIRFIMGNYFNERR